ncbi:hypothetical protein [Streptococcus mutans]|jgi:hypothetical protein|uniref:Uncharacterized protein n=1 Tax=Streptococcus mutans serotype c (strain ATCC 700610 / UA159) TaxID=210007 RepID=Q8DW62_STRMU|nr:hypothetical protein [Streptococcus mutans]AAN57985.1 hypothetical protein SMU_213c [Streptococcus mutans UA159]EMB84089.1 hypothetical protein SMU54_07847 [Streptococcus mutans A9]EMC18237.1 hypothetical protein SMU77_04085 [Streptococcus mutans NV1996]EMP60256.1 hypothetical protein D817_00970 [Streptococcus mutans KK21]MCB4930697.1 hypothetical protein [Streptococcus mutans]
MENSFGAVLLLLFWFSVYVSYQWYDLKRKYKAQQRVEKMKLQIQEQRAYNCLYRFNVMLSKEN